MWTCRRWSRWSITRWREDGANAMSPPVTCPRRPSTLGAKEDGGGRERPACPAQGFGFFHFGDASIGCGGVVIRDGKASLTQRGLNPGRGTWKIPGGYVEDDEAIPAAAEREVLEEAGGSGVGAGGSRLPALGEQARPVERQPPRRLRLELVSGEPRGDGVGTLDAGVSPWPNSRRRLACRRCRCGRSSSPLTGSCSRRSWTTSTINIASPTCRRSRPVRAERCQPLGRQRVG